MAVTDRHKNRKGKKKEGETIVTQIVVRSANRSEKDSGDFNNAINSAIRVYHPNRKQLYDIIENYIIDGYVHGLMRKRIDAVLNKFLYFRKDDKRDESFDVLRKNGKLRLIVEQILLQLAWGLSAMEFRCVPEGNDFILHILPRKHIKPEVGKITLQETGGEGYDYENTWNLWVIGDRHDFGYLTNCMPYAIWKRGMMADLAEFIEMYGKPIRKMTYDMHDPQSKIEAQKTLAETGSVSEIFIPEGIDLELVESKQGASNGQLQDSARKAMNDEMSVIILGNTETTSSSKSSGYAQAKEHSKQQLEITKSDMEFVLTMLNSKKFLNILEQCGFDTKGGEWVFEKEYDHVAVRQQMSIAMMMERMGHPVDADELYELSGYDKPADYDKRVKEKQALKEQKEQQKTDDPENTIVVTPGWKKLLNKYSPFQ